MIKEEANNKSDIDVIHSLWDTYAEAGYEKLYKGYSFKKILEIMNQMFEDSNDGIILDGGCGTGSMFESIIKKIKPEIIVAADWSEKMLAKAKKTSEKLLKNHRENVKFRFEKVDMTKKFPYSDNTFNAEIFNISICYLPLFDGWQHTIREAFRTVKPGCYIYISTFLKGFNFQDMMKKYKLKALKEVLASPIGIYHSMKLKKYPIKIAELSRKRGMEYPDKKDLDNLIGNKLGFIKREEKEIFWGTGVALKLQKSFK